MNKQELIEKIADKHYCSTETAEMILASIDAEGWLRNPDQVPGRTITRSKYRDTLDRAVKVSGYGDDWERGFGTGLAVSGTKVVPDPEPTNAEKLEAALRTHFGPGAFTVECSSLSRFLDGVGVKAPEAGGDDEH